MATYISWLVEEINRLQGILDEYGIQWEPAKPFDMNCDHERTKTQGDPSKPAICLDCGQEL